MAEETSLTGQWQGQYSYAELLEPTPFTAALVEQAGMLGGSITERSTLRASLGKPLYASVNGQRDGAQLHFIKTYEPGAEGYGAVAYAGQISADCNEITGEWSIGTWRGRFLMIRAGAALQAERREAGVKA